MISCVLFTIISFIYCFILAILYFSKLKFKNLRTNFFRFLFYFELLFLIFQIIAVYFIYINNTIYTLFWKLSWISCILWYTFTYYYFSASFSKESDNNIFKFILKNKFNLLIGIFSMISILLYFIFYNNVSFNIENVSFLATNNSYYIWLLCFIMCLFSSVSLIKNKKNCDMNDFINIILFITFSILFLILQTLFKNISIFPLGFCVELYILYLTTESPDLILLKENQKIKENIIKIKHDKKTLINNLMNSVYETAVSFKRDIDNIKNSKDFNYNYNLMYEKGDSFLTKTDDIFNLFNLDSSSINEIDYLFSDFLDDLFNLSNKFNRNNLKYAINIDRNIPNNLRGDYNKLFQVISNIYTNAIQYTRVGKIVINISCEKSGDNCELTFNVIDTGDGIKQNTDILDLDSVDKNQTTGIGLVISKEYINFLNGKIWYESDYKVGTSFYVKVNQKIIGDSLLGEYKFKKKDKKSFINNNFSNKKILVVDDNVDDIEIFKRLVSKCNLIIEDTFSSDDCINRIKLENKYDLILLDDVMPDFSGLETLKAIKAINPDCPPIILTTSSSISNIEENTKELGFSDCLSKPYNINSLEKILNRYLNNL